MFFSLNLRTLAAKHGYRQVHADPANLKRFQEVKRVTVDEPFRRMYAGHAFRRRRYVGPIAWRK